MSHTVCHRQLSMSSISMIFRGSERSWCGRTLGLSTKHKSKGMLKQFQNHRAKILTMRLPLQSSARNSEATKKPGLNLRWFQFWNWARDRPQLVNFTRKHHGQQNRHEQWGPEEGVVSRHETDRQVSCKTPLRQRGWHCQRVGRPIYLL